MTTTTDTPTTEQVVFELLTENTGRHSLDSGGAYGRAWERNQSKTLEDFKAEPEARWDGYGVTLSVFHFLSTVLDYDAEADAAFQAWCEDREDTHYMEDMEEYAEFMGGRANTVNSYNGEDLLSQTIQYTAFIPDEANPNGDCWWDTDEAIILLQVHGGCDVRGGYTRPRAFRNGSWDRTILDNARCSVSCEGQDPPQQGEDLFGEDHGRTYHSWSMYNGYGFDANNDEDEFPSDMPLGPDGEPICPMCSAKLGVYAD